MAIASWTAFCLSFTQIAIAAPVFSTSTPEVSLPGSARLDQAMQISVPSSIATIEKLQPGSGKTIFHIQTAHGHYQAQQNINLLLKDLEKNYGVKTVLIEGSTGTLNSEIINFFPNNHDQTMRAVDLLTRKAILKGSEIYLLQSPSARGLGIEDDAAYEKNLQDFAAVAQARNASSQFLTDLDQNIERLSAVYLDSNLRSFLKRVERKETGDVPFDAYLQELKIAAKKSLNADLDDASLQLIWPMLLRVFTIEKLEKKIDAGSFAKEKDAFLKAIKPYTGKNLYSEVAKLLNLKDLSAHLPDPETSILFQSLVQALPESFDYSRFSSVTSFCGILMLKSQIQADVLSEEITKMEDKIADVLAEKKAAKEVVSILKDYRMLKKLFALELVPADFDRVAKQNILPSQITARLKKINGDARAKEVIFKNTADLDALYAKAIRFYEGARFRDGKMLERIEDRLAETGSNKVAVITGGFHSEPFAQYFQKRGYNYALMTPKITTVDDEGRNGYLNVMMWYANANRLNGKGGSRAKTAAAETASTLQGRQQDLDLLAEASSQLFPAEVSAGVQNHLGQFKPGHFPVKNLDEVLVAPGVRTQTGRIPANLLPSNRAIAPAIARSESRYAVFTNSVWTAISEAVLKVVRAFGTNGIRGTGFNVDELRRMTAATALELKAEWEKTHGTEPLPVIGVAADPRPQGLDGFLNDPVKKKAYTRAMAEVLAAIGFPVRFYDEPVGSGHMIATTSADYPAEHRNFAVLMGTASHNEVVDPENGELQFGLKVFKGNAPIVDAFAAGISRHINGDAASSTPQITEVPVLAFETAVAAGRIEIIEDAAKVEVDRLDAAFNLAEIGELLRQKFPTRRYALNTMNGGMSKLAVQVFERMGFVDTGDANTKFRAFNTEFMNDPAMEAKVMTWVDGPNGTKVRFAPDPTRAHFRGKDYDAFMAADPANTVALLIDGDADRLVLELLGEISPNQIGPISKYYLQKYLGDQDSSYVDARTVPTTSALDLLNAALKVAAPKVTDVGSKNFVPVLGQLQIGLEESGHIAFRYKGQVYFDHPIALMLLMLRMMADTGKTWRELEDEMWAFIAAETGAPRIETFRVGIAKNENAAAYFPLAAKLVKDEALRKEFGEALAQEFSAQGLNVTLAGFDTTAPGGVQFHWSPYVRGMPRKSGTDGSLRIYFEAPAAQLEKLKEIGKPTMQRVLDRFLARSESRSQVELVGDDESAFPDARSESRLGRTLALATATVLLGLSSLRAQELSIGLINTNQPVVTYSSGPTGALLQSTPSVGANAPWTTISSLPAETASFYIPSPGVKEFYRLELTNVPVAPATRVARIPLAATEAQVIYPTNVEITEVNGGLTATLNFQGLVGGRPYDLEVWNGTQWVFDGLANFLLWGGDYTHQIAVSTGTSYSFRLKQRSELRTRTFPAKAGVGQSAGGVAVGSAPARSEDRPLDASGSPFVIPGGNGSGASGAAAGGFGGRVPVLPNEGLTTGGRSELRKQIELKTGDDSAVMGFRKNHPGLTQEYVVTPVIFPRTAKLLPSKFDPLTFLDENLSAPIVNKLFERRIVPNKRWLAQDTTVLIIHKKETGEVVALSRPSGGETLFDPSEPGFKAIFQAPFSRPVFLPFKLEYTRKEGGVRTISLRSPEVSRSFQLDVSQTTAQKENLALIIPGGETEVKEIRRRTDVVTVNFQNSPIIRSQVAQFLSQLARQHPRSKEGLAAVLNSDSVAFLVNQGTSEIVGIRTTLRTAEGALNLNGGQAAGFVFDFQNVGNQTAFSAFGLDLPASASVISTDEDSGFFLVADGPHTKLTSLSFELTRSEYRLGETADIKNTQGFSPEQTLLVFLSQKWSQGLNAPELQEGEFAGAVGYEITFVHPQKEDFKIKVQAGASFESIVQNIARRAGEESFLQQYGFQLQGDNVLVGEIQSVEIRGLFKQEVTETELETAESGARSENRTLALTTPLTLKQAIVILDKFTLGIIPVVREQLQRLGNAVRNLFFSAFEAVTRRSIIISVEADQDTVDFSRTFPGVDLDTLQLGSGFPDLDLKLDISPAGRFQMKPTVLSGESLLYLAEKNPRAALALIEHTLANIQAGHYSAKMILAVENDAASLTTFDALVRLLLNRSAGFKGGVAEMKGLLAQTVSLQNPDQLAQFTAKADGQFAKLDLGVPSAALNSVKGGFVFELTNNGKPLDGAALWAAAVVGALLPRAVALVANADAQTASTQLLQFFSDQKMQLRYQDGVFRFGALQALLDAIRAARHIQVMA